MGVAALGKICGHHLARCYTYYCVLLTGESHTLCMLYHLSKMHRSSRFYLIYMVYIVKMGNENALMEPPTKPNEH